jgi:signal transduction histidine kinase
VESPVRTFFVFHIVIASMFFDRLTSFTFTALAIGLYSGVVLLEYFSILPHYPIGSLKNFPIYANLPYIALMLAFFNSTLVILTYLVTSISERLRRREDEVLRLSENLHRSSAKLQALNESSQVVNSTLEISQVLDLLVANTARVMGVRACSIRLLDKTGKQLDPVAAYGLSQEYLNKGPIEIENSPLDREVLEGKIINIPDVSHTSLLQYPDSAAHEGISSMVSAPLIGKNGQLGILRAYSEDVDHFTSDDEAFLSAIAAQGSSAIENALAYQTIETLDTTKAAFIRVFTHELRSPVSVTRSLLQTILSGYAGEITTQQQDILERAVRRIDFLRKLIDDLLDLANGRVPQRNLEESTPIALEGVVENVVHRFEMPAREKGLTLEWHPDPEGGESLVLATVEGIDRIFNNLVSNAVKYTLEGGKVVVSFTRMPAEVQVKVEDTGIGIPDEAMPNLFEEFFRAPNARIIEREGTGLGLSIGRETIHSMGGRISVQTRLGVGSCFTVVLPLAEPSKN